MTKYSYTIFPSIPLEVKRVLSVILTSYFSKSFGKITLGCFNNLRFPTPLISIVNVTGCPAFTIDLFNLVETLNFPTPPEKFEGRLGNGST